MSVTVDAALAAVPMSGADITDLEVSAVSSVLRSGALSIGPKIGEFERSIGELVGSPHAIGVSSGTAGLHLAVIASGVEEGDVVLTTPFSFVASANCVLYERGIPVFVDVDPVTGNMDPVQAAEAIRDLSAGGDAARRWLPPSLRNSSKVGAIKAVLPIHAFGQPADMDPIVEAAHAHGLSVIEDACEAIGATYKNRPAGSIGDAGVFAFYPNKQLTTGEGGMMVTRHAKWADLFRSLRNQGRDNMDAWLRHDRLGYNYRMSELSAALGAAQMARFDHLLNARDRVAGWYLDRLKGLRGVCAPQLSPNTTRMSWFAFVVRLARGMDRDRVMAELAERGIPSRSYFSPIHLQPFYIERFGYERGAFPVTESLGDAGLALPFSAKLTEAQVDRVCNGLAAVVSSIGR